MNLNRVLLGAVTACMVAGVIGTPAQADVHAAECPSIPARHDPAVIKTVYQVGKSRGVSDKVMLASFETGWVESHMNNLNCGDRDSLGVFQQRPSMGWGTPEQIMDVRYAATRFFHKAQLLEPKMPDASAGRLSQAVQVSAHPDRYDQAEAKARSLLDEAKRLAPGLIDNDLPKYQSTGRVVAAPSLDGRLEEFAGGADGIWHRFQTQVNGGWSEWLQLGGIPDARLALGRSADGRLELFAVNDTTTLHRYQTQANGGWSDWGTFAGGGIDIAVMPSADGRLEVFLAGHEQVYHRYQRQANGDWSDWAAIGGTGRAKLGFGRSGDGRLEVFAVSEDTTVQTYQTQVNGGWAPWIHVAEGGTDIAVAPAADGRLEVFLARPDGVHHRYQRSHTGDWSDWAAIGGLGDAQISAARNADGRLEVVTTNGIESQQNWQTAPNHGFAGWIDMLGFGRDINLATNEDGRLEIHLAGDDQIWTRWQQQVNGHWTDWTPVGGPRTS